MNELKTISQMVQPKTALDIQADVNLIQEVMQQVMVKDTHYGAIPGCGNKNTLLKAGAEKIASAFRLVLSYDVEDLSNLDKVHYRITAYIHANDGTKLGEGLGECSSDEEKYKWRFACEGEYNDTEENKRRRKWKAGWQGKPDTQITQIRTEPADQANTILKMAKKRAQVDAVLTVTAASDIFTQDIEDLPPEYVAPHAEPEQTILPVYPDDKFQANKNNWLSAIDAGNSTPDSVINTVSTKYTLTEQQQNEIRGIK